LDKGEDAMKASVERIREGLLARRHALIEQVAHVEDDLRWLDTNVEPEMVEEGQEETLARLLTRLDDHDRSEVDDIDRALNRISGGTYGVCTACGKAIPVRRLEALPTADRCVACAE
jgi:RNA polymerase-binding protein DksA